MSLAQKLAKLHVLPAPIPEGYSEPQSGFSSPTCCGDTPQDNSFSTSWANCYGNRQVRFIITRAEKANGHDNDLASLVENICITVFPRLIADNALNSGQGITPVVVHGDLCSGNCSIGKLAGMSQPSDLASDSSACCTLFEYELGIMKMFDGFGGLFLTEYPELGPMAEPKDEYEDRVAVYHLHHSLHHFALFGGYKHAAVGIISRLISEYGSEKGEL